MWINNRIFKLLLVLGIMMIMATAGAQQSEPVQKSEPAQEAKPTQEALEPPPLPPKLRAEEEPPVVSIRTEENKTIEEYRQNGRLYMVKITPKNGISYYYMDLDGDGDLELQPYEDGLSPVAPAMWKLKEW